MGKFTSFLSAIFRPSSSEKIVGFADLKDKVALIREVVIQKHREYSLLYSNVKGAESYHFSNGEQIIELTNLFPDYRTLPTIIDIQSKEGSASQHHVIVRYLDTAGITKVRHAITKDFSTWQNSWDILHNAEKTFILPNQHPHEPAILLSGDNKIELAVKETTSNSYWHQAASFNITPRGDVWGKYHEHTVHLCGAVREEGGVVMLYVDKSVKDNALLVRINGLEVEAERPDHVTWRGEDPFFEDTIVAEDVMALGVFTDSGYVHAVLKIYLADNKEAIYVATFPHPFAYHKLPHSTPQLERAATNPILEPSAQHWESEGAFNPAAVVDQDKIHIFYRAIGPAGISAIGYATSSDGVTIDERFNDPVYYPRKDFEGAYVGPDDMYHYSHDLYASGGGWGGCEDPKVTIVGDRLYLTYVAYSPGLPQRVAISSIDLEDFRAKRWNWSEPEVMSRPGVVTKSPGLFPRKINDNYVLFHRMYPDVQLDYRDELTFGEGKWLRSHQVIPRRLSHFDSRKLSIGATPIETEEGWLTIYHGTDDRSRNPDYSIGAMMLDRDNPGKVLYRSSIPVLKPETHYENWPKAGVAYPCGAVVKDDNLHVYYGAGDRSTCVASSKIKDFLYQLKHEFRPKLHMNASNLLPGARTNSSPLNNLLSRYV